MPEHPPAHAVPPDEPASQHAPAHRTVADPPQGPVTWRELGRDFLKPNRAQLVLAVILLVCGFAAAVQVQSRGVQQDYANLRRADLVQLLDDLNAESRRLESELIDLERTHQQLLSGADRQRVAREEAQRRLDVLSILAGTAPATGQGVRITINDPNGKVTPEILLNALEELRDAGAEVMELNGTVRVVATSWVGTGPGGLIVDDQTLSRPIVISAIGDPHALSEAARFRGGLVSEVQDDRVGGSVTIVTDQQIVITAIHSPKALQFARPA